MRPDAEPIPARCVLALLLAVGCTSQPGITPIRTPFNKGVYHHSRGDLDLAITEYRQALAEDPDDHRARFNLAAALDERGRQQLAAGDVEASARSLQAAEQQYRQVLARQPDELRANVNLAALEYERGDVGAAIARLERTIARQPDLALPRTALALRLLEHGDLPGAERQLTAALRSDPDDLGANLLHGDLLAQRGDVDGARLAYLRALRRAPDDPGTLVALGRLELRGGRQAEALSRLEQVVLQHPTHREAHLLLADLHEQRGELEDAVFHLWRARDLGPAAAVPATEARLRSLYQLLLQRGGANAPTGSPR